MLEWAMSLKNIPLPVWLVGGVIVAVLTIVASPLFLVLLLVLFAAYNIKNLPPKKST